MSYRKGHASAQQNILQTNQNTKQQRKNQTKTNGTDFQTPGQHMAFFERNARHSTMPDFVWECNLSIFQPMNDQEKKVNMKPTNKWQIHHDSAQPHNVQCFM